MAELSTKYQSREVESRWYSEWESKGYFKPRSDREGKNPNHKRYGIVIPPPNVTGILHMGHALNNSIQDILIRYHRMKGEDTLWVPGVDHAGIATQNVVEKKLAKEKITRHALGREKFLEEVWKWKQAHGATITKQLRRLGASCDWSRERFTLDEGLSLAVREAFVTLYERGLIYQGNYIINWCPRCQTALSDEEAVHKEVQGGLYHIKYPLKGTVPQKGDRLLEQVGVDHIVVATTRPETMLGDTAVAVHPEDERYKHLIGKKVILPLLGREILVIADEFVDREFGTGIVKVTPAHDPNDFEMGQRHHLPQINVMHPDGKINAHGGPYSGMDRFQARKKIIEDLEVQGFFLRRDSHLHAVGHCYRCDTLVEPYLSKQWFVKMKPLADKALKAHREGKTKFYPDRWTKVYTNWLEHIRDWCISRQIWWGHQIPVWYCDPCQMLEDPNAICHSEDGRRPDKESKILHPVKSGTQDDNLKTPAGVIVSRETPTKCPNCGNTSLKQDPDVLDTWFSSWLWPFSTLGWPEKTEDLSYFYPTSDLITAPEIIFFWVARMIMAGLEFRGEVPFSRIYIHGTVRAQTGLKMSKSLGNAIDPIEVIEEMGADALRFSMIMLSAQDVYLSREKFEVGRNFTNKLWNASRFVLMHANSQTPNGTPFPAGFDSLFLPSRWILSRLHHIRETLERHLLSFEMAQAAAELYHFVWNDFCDWFIELSKPSLLSSNVEEKKQTQEVLCFSLEQILRLLHPFMPFITEEIWQQLKSLSGQKVPHGTVWPETLMLAVWPLEKETKFFENAEAEASIDILQRSVGGLRDIRARLGLPPSQALPAIFVSPQDKVRDLLKHFETQIKVLARASELRFEKNYSKSSGFVGNAFPDFEVLVKIEGLVDPVKERERIEKKISESKDYVTRLREKLRDQQFTQRAPAGLVEKEKAKLADAEKVLKAHQEHLALFQ
ncbi:MAG: valine--tRNA ligase [Candidatus Omnitrophica bacterium]|nr:valine--tRNA ligase [Candidatus Omnitrophota bacterium]